MRAFDSDHWANPFAARQQSVEPIVQENITREFSFLTNAFMAFWAFTGSFTHHISPVAILVENMRTPKLAIINTSVGGRSFSLASHRLVTKLAYNLADPPAFSNAYSWYGIIVQNKA